MIAATSPSTASRELSRINDALASILHVPPLSLSQDGEATLADNLVLCGVLGGKNVGKSTLINALARRRVSVDRDAAVRGTDRPVVYVHADEQRAATLRLNAITNVDSITIVTHSADDIRNLVLVDLPDFDSEFLDHVEIVRRVVPLLDRVIWVATPRKLGDRAWVELLSDVLKDAGNVHFALNKMDELLADADPFATTAPADAQSGSSTRNGSNALRFRATYDQWLADVTGSAGCNNHPDHRFLIAAAFDSADALVSHVGRTWNDADWTRFAPDRQSVHEVGQLLVDDLNRLRQSVLTPLSTDEVRAIKQSNRACTLSVYADWMRKHYELARTLRSLKIVRDDAYAESAQHDAFGDELIAGFNSDVMSCMRSDRALADDLLERRVDAWPLLRLIHWPMGWLARTVGRRVAPIHLIHDPRSDRPRHRQQETLQHAVELLRSHILADVGAIGGQLRVEQSMPRSDALAQNLCNSLDELPARCEAQLIERIRSQDRRPSLIGRTMLWWILLWFPLVQPIGAGLLEMYVETGTIHLLHGIYRVVTALSAAHLLTGCAVVAGIYVAILAGMYARALRTIRRALREEAFADAISDAIDQSLRRGAMDPLLAPLVSHHDRLHHLIDRLATIAK